MQQSRLVIGMCLVTGEFNALCGIPPESRGLPQLVFDIRAVARFRARFILTTRHRVHIPPFGPAISGISAVNKLRARSGVPLHPHTVQLICLNAELARQPAKFLLGKKIGTVERRPPALDRKRAEIIGIH
jgi:hypothetical protein